MPIKCIEPLRQSSLIFIEQGDNEARIIGATELTDKFAVFESKTDERIRRWCRIPQIRCSIPEIVNVNGKTYRYIPIVDKTEKSSSAARNTARRLERARRRDEKFDNTLRRAVAGHIDSANFVVLEYRVGRHVEMRIFKFDDRPHGERCLPDKTS